MIQLSVKLENALKRMLEFLFSKFEETLLLLVTCPYVEHVIVDAMRDRRRGGTMWIGMVKVKEWPVYVMRNDLHGVLQSEWL